MRGFDSIMDLISAFNNIRPSKTCVDTPILGSQPTLGERLSYICLLKSPERFGDRPYHSTLQVTPSYIPPCPPNYGAGKYTKSEL